MTPNDVLDRMQAIIDRSDTHFGGRKAIHDPVGRWKGKVPDDFLALWSEINGLNIAWGFDASVPHGPRFYALTKDGRSLRCPRSGEARFRQMPARDHEYLGDEVRGWGNDPVIVFEGFQGEGGLLLRTLPDGSGEYYGFDSDGDINLLATNLATFLEQGLASGFAYGWERGRADDVIARLQADVAPREQFRLALLERTEVPAAEHRRALGGSLPKTKFNAIMKAMGSDLRHDGGDAEARADAFEALLGDAKGVKANQAKAVLKAMKWKGASKKALTPHLRWGEGPRVVLTLKAQDTSSKGAPPVGLSPSISVWKILKTRFPNDDHPMPSAPLWKKKESVFTVEVAGDSDAAAAIVDGWCYVHQGAIGTFADRSY